MAERFLNACQDLGVTKLLFIRHANSLPISGANRQDQPHDWKFRDQTRLLSDKGKDQCLTNRSLITEFEIKANLTSPARRASETAARLTIGPGGGDIFLRMIESLHPAGMSATCEDLFDSMGYGPVRFFYSFTPSIPYFLVRLLYVHDFQLRKFFEVDGGRDAFLAYANNVCAELAAKTSGPAIAGVSCGDTIAIFGHAVFLNAVAFVIADYWGFPDVDFILDVDLGEAEVLVIDKSENRITHRKP